MVVFREECSNAESGTRTVEFHHCGRVRDMPDGLGVLSLLWAWQSPKHHKSPPGLECWNSSMMREAAGAVPLLKEKMLTPSFATEG